MANRQRRTSTSSKSASPAPVETVQGQAEAPATNRITVRIGQLGGTPRVVTGTAGMTVSEVLRQAELTLGGKNQLMLRGVPIEANAVLESDVMLIVSGNISGG